MLYVTLEFKKKKKNKIAITTKTPKSSSSPEILSTKVGGKDRTFITE